jgi:sortase (surface protein transpeptidase)
MTARLSGRVATVAVAALLGGGATAYLAGRADPPDPVTIATVLATPAVTTPAVTTPAVTTPGPTPVADNPPAPTGLRVPRLGITMSVVPEGVDATGAMALPEDPAVAGWYRYGPTPGQTGAAVLAAHIDSRALGIGPIARLRGARVGDQILVDLPTGTRSFQVTQVLNTSKTVLDTAALFDRTGSPRLHLVTCTGRYLPGQGYEQNLVVVAEPAGSS